MSVCFGAFRNPFLVCWFTLFSNKNLMCDEDEWVQRSALGKAAIRVRHKHLPQSA